MIFSVLELIILFQSSTERLSNYIQRTAYLDEEDMCEVLFNFNPPIWLLKNKLEDFPFDWEDIRFKSWFANNYINACDNLIIIDSCSSWYKILGNSRKLFDAVTNIFLPLEPGFEKREFTSKIYNDFKLFRNIVGDIEIPRLVLESVYIYSSALNREYCKYLKDRVNYFKIVSFEPILSDDELIIEYMKYLDEKNTTYTPRSEFTLEFPIEDLFRRLKYMENNNHTIETLEDVFQLENSIRDFCISFR